jgi:hypothetical protein
LGCSRFSFLLRLCIEEQKKKKKERNQENVTKGITREIEAKENEINGIKMKFEEKKQNITVDFEKK